MRLNWLGRAAMNSRCRRLGQVYVASWFERLGGKVEGGRVLEMGCGGGRGVRIILERFGAAEVEAIDLDPKMIERARRALSRFGSRVRFRVGNFTALKAQAASFDAVFDFGAIHLEPDWRRAVAEVARVLKPEGRFFFELVTTPALRLAYPLVTEAFGRMEPPGREQFVQELELHELTLGKNFVQPWAAALTGFVGDLIGVARPARLGGNSGPREAGR